MDKNDETLNTIQETQLWILSKITNLLKKLENYKTIEEYDIIIGEIKELRGRNLNLKKDIDKLLK